MPFFNLAEMDYLPAEALGFPGDESAITALFCTSNFLLVGKESKKLYAFDLALDNPGKKPFISKIVQNESTAIQITFWTDSVIAVLADGIVKGFSLPDLQAKDDVLRELNGKNISCVSVFQDAAAFGCKDSNEIIILKKSGKSNLNVPADNGENGVSSLYFASTSTLLCSLVAADENEYVDLISIENPFEDSPRFTKFLDPCASRPPAPNQFYFCGINDWSRQDLSELVLVGNFGSPDIGVAARLSPEEPFGTFFIDLDEGLAQLPLLKGSELTFPVGLALDFTSSLQHENRQDSDAEPFTAAPVLWILTSAGQLCPFALLKTNEAGPWPFMKVAPQLQFSPPRVLDAPASDADDSSPSSPAVFRNQVAGVTQSDLTLSSEEEDECSDSFTTEVPTTPSKDGIDPPLTPSKMSLSAIASLQKSSSDSSPTKPAESVKASESEKAAESVKTTELPKSIDASKSFELSKPVESSKPMVAETAKPTPTFAYNLKPKQGTTLPHSSPSASPMSIVSQEPTIPAPIKKEEKMENVTCSPYQSILLNEVAEAHQSMQNDLHALRQLAYKNSILLRQNTVKYFSTLEALEKYAGKVESLLGSGERVFASLKYKSTALKASFEGVAGEAKRLQIFCDGIKNDAKIDWRRKASQLEQLSEEVTAKISQLQDILAQPAAKRASLATITCLHQSIQERLQLLMIYLSTLFVSFATEADDSTRGTLERMRSLCLSSESLIDEMSALFIASAELPSKKKRHDRLLEISKARGARLLIPSGLKKPQEAIKAAPIVKLSVDDKLIEEFISAVKLNDSVPEFRDNASASAAATLETSNTTTEKPAITNTFNSDFSKATSPSTEPAPKLFSFAQSTAEPTKPKPFSFAPTTEAAKPKPVIETKPSSSFTKPESAAFYFDKTTDASKPFSFGKPAEAPKAFTFAKSEAKNSASESEESTSKDNSTTNVTNFQFKPEGSADNSNSETKPFSLSSNETKPFSLPNNETKPFSLSSNETTPFSLPNSETKPFSFSFNAPTTESVKTNTEPVVEKKTETTAVEASSPSSEFSFLSFSSTPETSTSDKDALSFKFDFTPSAPSKETEEKAATTSTEIAKKPIPGILSVSPAEPEKTPIPALLTSQNAFAPPSLTSSQKAASSLTSTPSFSTTSLGSTVSPAGFSFSSPAATSIQPAFGQPSFGQTSSLAAQAGPAFGQTSMPNASFMPAVNTTAPKPGAFAAFAQTNAQSLGFSSFTAPAATSNGLSFASFANPNANSQSSAEEEKDKKKSSFSFSGFRG